MPPRNRAGDHRENPQLPIAPFHQQQLRGRLARIQHILDSHRNTLRAAILANDQPQIDDRQNGLINDTITRGAQVTVGMEF